MWGIQVSSNKESHSFPRGDIGRLIIQKSVHRLPFRKLSAPVQRFSVHPVYTFYNLSEASVVGCSTNPTWRQNGESRNLTNDFK